MEEKIMDESIPGGNNTPVIKEQIITKHILDQFHKDFISSLDIDIAIAGAGPSGLIAGMDLARKGKKVVIFERKLSIGGGMWGGGMTFPTIVVQEPSVPILEECRIKTQDVGEGYFTADSIEATCKLTSSSIDAGVKIFNTMSVEDVIYKNERISGVVINWSAVEIAGLHVDPLSIGARAVIDATGHPSEVCNIVQKKIGKLSVPSGKIEGEKSMWAEEGERTVIENTGEVFPGLYVTGMAANAVFGGPRMGPIFGGMLLSGRKVAELILKDLE
jgi:thiamine thiazole synthase